MTVERFAKQLGISTITALLLMTGPSAALASDRWTASCAALSGSLDPSRIARAARALMSLWYSLAALGVTRRWEMDTGCQPEPAYSPRRDGTAQPTPFH